MPKFIAYTYEEAAIWSVDDVGEWLRHLGFHEFVEPFEKYNINGKELFELSEHRLQRLYPNMPTGKSDPASMLWKQINKVKENRKTGKKSKISFSGWGSDKKQPPKAPEPDYNPSQQYREPNSYDQGSEDEEWDSDFSNEDDGQEFDQKGDVPSSQGNQGRSLSYNSSTSSFTNLSSSASGKDDDSSLLYLAPNTGEGDYNQTYEVPSEQMNSSYGDGDCDEIYDVPHDEDQSANSLQPDTLRRHQHGERSVSPQPLLSPRHEAVRPLPNLPPTQLPHWQQQQQLPPEPPGRPSSRQMPPTPHRPPHSPHHYPRPGEMAPHEAEEQENYEVPNLDQPNYEAPLLETQDHDDVEEEYLVPVPDGSSYKSQQPAYLPPDTGGSRPFMNRPPAPLPSVPGTPGLAPPRPVKPPELIFSGSEPAGRRREVAAPPEVEEDGPPPIPSRPAAGRAPPQPESAGRSFSKLLPDPPPHVIREAIISRPEEPTRDRSPVRPAVFQSSANGSGVGGGSVIDENRNFGPRGAKIPPPLPTNSARDFRMGQERDETFSASSSASSAGVPPVPATGTVASRLKQFHRPADESASASAEPGRPALAPRPFPKHHNGASTGKPAPAARPLWAKPAPAPAPAPAPEQTPPGVAASAPSVAASSVAAGKWSLPPPPTEMPDMPLPPPLPQAPAAVPQRPVPRPRQIPEPPAAPEPKAMPSIPTKEPPKIKKYTPHASRTHTEPPKQEKAQPPPEPEKPRASPKHAKPNEMTGYPWYDTELTRDEASKILKQTKMDGAFVVRDSTRGDGSLPYSLSLWYNNKVRNLQIRLRSDGKYALGRFKENEQVFDSAVLLIQYHMTNPLILAGDVGKTCLKVAAPNFR